jgi:hypothetical protein
MTPHQMVCHLADSFRMGMGRRSFQPADSLFGRTVLKWGALYLPLPWPPGFPTRPEVNPLRGGTRPGDFDIDLADLETSLDAFTDAQLEGRAHPIFGPLSSSAWLRWGWLHTDHHLRQFGL